LLLLAENTKDEEKEDDDFDFFDRPGPSGEVKKGMFLESSCSSGKFTASNNDLETYYGLFLCRCQLQDESKVVIRLVV
jgi:hypothetical protein